MRSGGAANITTLTITDGMVTAADWNFVKSLTALTDFTIDEAVASVANMPDASNISPLFPSSIKSVSIPQAITIGDNAFNTCASLANAEMHYDADVTDGGAPPIANGSAGH